MARPTLMTHRKFGRLARSIGSVALARGILEIIWDGCYEAGDDYLGTAADIEQRIGWAGEPGHLALALVACGLPEGHGFIEPVQPEHGQEVTYRVHDLWHHAPDYVMKRHKREMERRQKVEPVTVDRRTAPNGGQCPVTPDSQTEVDRTPAPARAPAPAPARAQPADEARGERRALTTGGVMAGSLPRDHLNCRPPCERICLSQKQFALLVGRHGGAERDAERFVDEWAARVRSRIPPGPFGGKPWEFWQSAWDREFGATALPKLNRFTAAAVQAAQHQLKP